MSRLLTALLLGATLATPALAQVPDSPRRARADEVRDPRAGQRPDRDVRDDDDADIADFARDRPVRAEPPDQFDEVEQVGRRPDRRGRFTDRDAPRDDRFDEGYDDDDYDGDRDRDGRRHGVIDDRDDGYRGAGGYARGDDRYDRDDDRRQGGSGWNRNWRNDRRYDWQSYRRGNDRAFRMPRYYGPQGIGVGYRRWAPGYRIQPAYYGRNYWIARPDRYRLPPASGRYRWVRYYDDVALVDIRSGVIADILYAFFL